MAISNNMVVSSYAKNGTLGDQSGAASNEIIFDDLMSDTNNGDVDPAELFSNRLVIVRLGDPDEETRYIASEVGTTGTVNEDWVSPPVSGDTYFIPYGPIDADTIGNAFKVVLKRNTDWTTTKVITIQNGAGFAILDGHSIETVDNGSTTAADIVIESGGRWDSGYISSNIAVGGGQLFGTPALDGELVLDVQSGGEANFYDFFMSGVFNNKSYYNGTVRFRKAKLFSVGYNMDLTGEISMSQGSSIAGRGTANDNIILDASTWVDGLILTSTNGFTTADDSVTETITVKNVTFVGNNQHVTVHNDKTWDFINPVWTVDDTTQDDIVFAVDSANEVNEKFSLNIVTQESSGDVISGSSVYIYEGLTNQNLPVFGTTDTTGEFSDSIRKNTYTDDGGTALLVATTGDFAIKVYRYGYSPFVSAQTVDSAIVSAVTLVGDSNLNATSASLAISNGDGVSVTQSIAGAAGPNTLLGYISGTVAFTPLEVVTGVISTATGTVVELADGDLSEGTIFIRSRNGIPFQFAEELNGDVTGRALVSTKNQPFTWEANASGNTLQATYDFLSAKLADTGSESIYQDVVAWGEDEQSLAIYAAGSNTYYTEYNSNLNKGVYVSNKGAGNISFFTDDSGSTYVPPSTITLTVAGVVENTRCAIYATGSAGPHTDGEQIMNALANADGDAILSYTYIGDQEIVVKARLASYLPFIGTSTITNADLTINAVWLSDPNFN